MMPQKSKTIFIVLLLIITAVLAAIVVLPFVTELILAIVLAVLLHPVYQFLLKRLGNKKNLAAALTVVIVVVCILTPFAVIGTQVVGETQGLYSSIQNGNGSNTFDKFSRQVNQKIVKFIPGANFDIRTEIGSALSWVTNNLALIISSTVQIVLSLFLVLVSIFFLLRDGEYFERSLIALSPLDDANDKKLISKISDSINAVIRGTVFIVVIQAAVAIIGFVLFGIPNPLLWGLLAGLAAVVPLFGTMLVVIPAAIFLFFAGSYWQAIGLALWGLVLAGSIDNFVKPYLFGRGIEIHPLIMLFAILGGLAVFGPLGFILGPIIIGFFASVHTMYKAEHKAA